MLNDTIPTNFSIIPDVGFQNNVKGNMFGKKSSKKTSTPPSIEASSSETASKASNEALRKRFGAKAYVENTDIQDENESILSLDSLREAFGALDEEESELNRASRAIFDQDESVGADYRPEEPLYDEDFSLDEDSPQGLESSEQKGTTDSCFEETPPIELNVQTILEAMLFMGDRDNRPLIPSRAADKMRNVTTDDIDLAVRELNRTYHQLGCPYTIRTESEGYRLVLRDEFEPILLRFYGKIREARLSQQAIDTLAVVAYRQPTTADEVQKIRRQPSGPLLAQLVRRGLLEIEMVVRDRKKVSLYRTTDRFLELFQIESIDDLPISEELDFQ